MAKQVLRRNPSAAGASTSTSGGTDPDFFIVNDTSNNWLAGTLVVGGLLGIGLLVGGWNGLFLSARGENRADWQAFASAYTTMAAPTYNAAALSALAGTTGRPVNITLPPPPALPAAPPPAARPAAPPAAAPAPVPAPTGLHVRPGRPIDHGNGTCETTHADGSPTGRLGTWHELNGRKACVAA